jgi:hypothetical protein
MPQVLQAVRNYLLAQRATHNGPDLIDRWLKFGGDMETQVNVHCGDGEPIDGGRFSDGTNTWGPLRIPRNANSEPYWNDYKLRWPLDRYCEAIGSTGFNWVKRTSEWVAFDFDGMSHGAGLDESQLNEVKAAAFALPYVEVRRSTSGNGYHLYVMLDSIPTKNHTEHAKLAKRVLRKMSADAGFDFASKVDVCGGNFWIWHRKANPTNQGFALVKAAE